MTIRKFDLNIERVLEHWTIAHAIREIIANALDEQALTGCAEPMIFKDDEDRWHIRDWGRGLKYDHLTQNENKEKLAHPDKVIGKFGVGLKDALATFNRHRIAVTMRSPHGTITTARENKHDFENLKTLHALISEPDDSTQVGTDIVLEGVNERDIETAKGFFLIYSDEVVLENTSVGSVLMRGKQEAKIYVNGLRIAKESEFLFSYNITSSTKPLRRALNRERSNVGRTAYRDSVKAILLSCQSPAVADLLATDLAAFGAGTMHDELKWVEVALHACRILNATQKVIFLTSRELTQARDFTQHAQDDGFRVVVVPENVREKLPQLKDLRGETLRDLTQYSHEWDQSFQFVFVPLDKLTPEETRVWLMTDQILRLAGGHPKGVRQILISETMRLQSQGYAEAAGIWDPIEQQIVIKRNQLLDLAKYAGVLLHEVTHARSGATDVSLEFEIALTEELGNMAARQLTQQS